MSDITEIVGYVAMTFLVLSFVPRQIRTVRLINLLACVIFIVYGVMLGLKWPIIISNALVGMIQMYHLFWMKRKINNWKKNINEIS